MVPCGHVVVCEACQPRRCPECQSNAKSFLLVIQAAPEFRDEDAEKVRNLAKYSTSLGEGPKPSGQKLSADLPEPL